MHSDFTHLLNQTALTSSTYIKLSFYWLWCQCFKSWVELSWKQTSPHTTTHTHVCTILSNEIITQLLFKLELNGKQHMCGISISLSKHLLLCHHHHFYAHHHHPDSWQSSLDKFNSLWSGVWRKNSVLWWINLNQWKINFKNSYVQSRIDQGSTSIATPTLAYDDNIKMIRLPTLTRLKTDVSPNATTTQSVWTNKQLPPAVCSAGCQSVIV